MVNEFKSFVLRGNVADMAVGIIVGGAFGAVVNTLVSEVLMPPLGLLIGGVDFSNFYLVLKQGSVSGPYASLAAARAAGAVTMNYGVFANAIISFLIMAFAVFMLIKSLTAIRSKPEPEAAASGKECPYCCSSVPVKATRCPACTSQLEK